MSALDQTAAVLSLMPFAAVLGIQEIEAGPAQVRASVDWDASRCTAGGILHGGFLMAVADSLGGYCAFLNLPQGSQTATIESKTNFLRPVRSGRVRAVARPLHVGRNVIVVDTELYDDSQRLVARVTQTQAVLPPR